MPVRIHKITKGKNKGKYRVFTPSGVKAKATTKKKADGQKRLIEAIEHGYNPKKGRKK
jgi:hypothetical protein